MNEPALQLSRRQKRILALLAVDTARQGVTAYQMQTIIRIWSSGSLYIALLRLEHAGIVASAWEEGNHYPRRRLYRLASPA